MAINRQEKRDAAAPPRRGRDGATRRADGATRREGGAWRGARLGFTLVELVAVIGIIVILVALGMPAFNTLNEAGQFSQVESTLISMGTRAQVRSYDQPAGLLVTRARRARQRPTYGWDSLTPTERRVVSRAVEGLTNREIAEQLFVSRRTVATHMEHIFQKLGCANRVELAADAARRDLSG